MLQDILTKHIELIYPDLNAPALAARLCAIFNLAPDGQAIRRDNLWSQEDSFLITYGDSIVSDHRTPLQTRCI